MVNIGTLRDLCQLLSHSHYYTPSINSAHLKRYQLAFPGTFLFQKPISAFLTLHPPHDAPSFRLMRDSKGDGLRAILRDSIVVVLLGEAKVSNGPVQRAA
jgi:hypothetical protein